MNWKRITLRAFRAGTQAQTTGWRIQQQRVLACTMLLGLAAFTDYRAVAADAEFSAELSMTVAGGITITGRVFVKGPKRRNETVARGRPATTILRQDKKVTWILLQASKEYREVPLRFDPLHPTSDSPYETKEMGADKANGYDCKMILWTFKNPDQGSVLQWFAPELKTGVRYQVKNKAGAVVNTVDYLNVKLGPQPDSLFEIPEGFTRQASPPRASGPASTE